MNIGIKINGNVTSDINAYLNRVKGELNTVLDKTARKVQSNQKRIVLIKDSEPGGNLWESIRIEFAPFERRIGPNLYQAPYAPYLEEGTKYIQAWHFVQDSLDNVQLQFENDIKRVI